MSEVLTPDESDEMAALVSRIWQAFNPPRPAKTGDALKFGILGAANIA
jgi:hypothetical protein